MGMQEVLLIHYITIALLSTAIADTTETRGTTRPADPIVADGTCTDAAGDPLGYCGTERILPECDTVFIQTCTDESGLFIDAGVTLTSIECDDQGIFVPDCDLGFVASCVSLGGSMEWYDETPGQEWGECIL